MKYLRKYNESLSKQDITDLLTMNLEDNDKFEVIDIKFGHTEALHPFPGEAGETWTSVIIYENWINNAEALELYKQALEKDLKGYSADRVEEKAKNFYAIRKLIDDTNTSILTKLGRKYDFRISEPQLVAEDYDARVGKLLYAMSFILKYPDLYGKHGSFK